MSNYRRFITYLFLYEAGEKRSQCGYARVEQKQNQGKIDFYIKGCGMDTGELVPCFYAQGGQVQIPIGRIVVKNSNAESGFRFECQRMGNTRHCFSEMSGLVIPLSDNRLILSQWTDEPYQFPKRPMEAVSDSIYMGDGQMESGVTAAEAMFDEANLQQPTNRIPTNLTNEARNAVPLDMAPPTRFDVEMEPEAERRVDTGVADRLNGEARAELNVEPAMQNPVNPTIQNTVNLTTSNTVNPTVPTLSETMQAPIATPPHQATSPAQNLEMQLRSLRPKYYPFQVDLSTWATQAQLREIKLLPRDYWKLANNSFVLRGYFNYGNVLIGYMDSEKSFFLGIPGIFQKQEKVIASLFGFTRFRGQNSVESRPGDFGYWYQLIDVV